MKLNVREISCGFPDFNEDGMCVEREIKKSIKRQLDKYTRKPKTDCKVALINFGYVRHIFKTEALVEYAKDNDCVVIRSLSVLEVIKIIIKVLIYALGLIGTYFEVSAMTSCTVQRQFDSSGKGTIIVSDTTFISHSGSGSWFFKHVR